MSRIPYKLFELRKHSSLSQNTVATYLGLETVEYMAIENGRCELEAELMEKLAMFYKIDKDVFNDEYPLDLSLIPHIDVQPTFDFTAVNQPTFFDLHHEKIKKAGIFVVIISLFFILNTIFSSPQAIPLDLELQIDYLLAANSQGYIYFEDGKLQYKGNNSNGQFSVSSIENAVAVYVNEEVSVVLLSDGSVQSVGNAKDKYPTSELRDIIEIQIAENFFLAKDQSNQLYCIGECDESLEGLTNIHKMITYNNQYIVIDDESNVFSNDLDTVALIEDIVSVQQIVSDEVHTIVLYDNGVADVIYDKNMDYYCIEDYQSIDKLVLLNDALALLFQDGTVVMISDNQDYELANTWKVMDIAGAVDYLIGYTYDEIMGVGNNSSNKFEKETKVETTTLASVENIQISISEKQLTITFDEVINADYYVLSFVDGISAKVVTAKASFSIDQFVDGQTYTVEIYAVSDSVLYLDSTLSTKVFTVEKIIVEPTPVPSVAPSEIPQVTPEITPDITGEPTEDPEATDEPSVEPTQEPTDEPLQTPTIEDE